MPGRVSNSRANMANRNKGKKRKPTKKSHANKEGKNLYENFNKVIMLEKMSNLE